MNHSFLFQRIKKLVSIERRIGVEILECLYEIEKRKAYAELRYDGLYTYCVKELGFSDSQAYQRIQAMRALKEIPELKPMIESGSLSVSAVSKVQTHLKQEKKSGVLISKPEKLILYKTMENKTSREVDQCLAEVRGEEIKEKLVLEMDEELKDLWERVKNLSAHKTHAQNTEILKLLANEWLKRNDPAPVQRTVPLSTRIKPTSDKTPASDKKPVRSRYIPSEIRKEIWHRDQSKCSRCHSKYKLEIDHKKAFALGGENTKENLRLLCRSCNQFAAVETFGFLGSHSALKNSASADTAQTWRPTPS